MQVDLAKYRSHGAKVFAGRERGLLVRQAANLDKHDKSGDPIEVLIPEDTISMNSSFFLGMFGPSIVALGEEVFSSRYKFLGRDISAVRENSVREALRETSPLAHGD